MDKVDGKISCSFIMLFCLWCDIFNTIIGVMGFHLHPPIALGYIFIHLISIIYLIFQKKIGFKYHLASTRFLMLVPCVFLLVFMLILNYKYYDRHYFSSGLEIYTVDAWAIYWSIGIGLAWSTICALMAGVSLCTSCTLCSCCFSPILNIGIQKGKFTP